MEISLVVGKGDMMINHNLILKDVFCLK